MGKNREVDMLHGSLWNKILLFALPIAVSSMLQQLFNSADIAVVGRFAGSEALAAVGSNQAIIGLLINLFVGMSVGANVVIGKLYGENKKEKISSAVHTALTVAIISGVFLIILGFFMTKILLNMMATPEDVIDLASVYLRIYFAGMPFIMVYNFGAAILRSVGDTKRPLICLTISGVINVVLNLFFVVVCNLSVAGVAIATVISNMVSSSMVLYILIHEKGYIKVDLRKLKVNKEILEDIVRIGLPAGIQGVVFSISNVCIQSSINSFGSVAIAGSAAAVNYEFFAYFLLNSFSQAAVTFTSQNFGAKQYKRCETIFNECLVLSIVTTMVLCFIFLIFKDPFLSIYTKDLRVKEFGFMRMKYVLVFQFLNCILDVASGTMRGMGYSLSPAIITIAGVCGFRLLWVYTVFEKYNSFKVLLSAYPISWVITSSCILISYSFVKRKYRGDVECVVV